MSVADFEIRAARLDEKDIETIVHQRRAMFFDMGHRDERALESMSEVSAVAEAEDGGGRVCGVVCDRSG